jgi:hypothetical protein
MGTVYASHAQALSDYQTYSTYESTASVADAQAFVSAAQYLLLTRPDQVGNNGHTLSINNTTLQKEIDRARIFINRMNGVGRGVKVLGADPTFRGRFYGGSDPLEVPT